MATLISHLRYTVRVLLKSPGFTITTVLSLGLGIGANTAIFSLINGVLLKPLPYPNADRLVQIFQPSQEVHEMPMAYSDYVDFCASQHTLQGLTVCYHDALEITGNGEPERIDGAYVTGSFFELLGRAFLLGKPIGKAEEETAASVVVLSEQLWRSRFHANPNVLGTNIRLNGRSFQIIGITPEQANEIRKIDLYLPFSLSPRFADVKSRRSGHMNQCIGRLRDGVTLQQAQAEFEVINQNLISRYPTTSSGFGIQLVPFLDSVVGDYSATLWLLGAAVSCLLAITCANTANLLLTRARERRKEITIRATLGASRNRLLIQLLTESLLLALIGGGLGLLVAYWAVAVIKTLGPANMTRLHTIGIDGTALLFVFGLTLLTTLLFGLLPALVLSRTDLTFALRDEGGRTGTAGPERQRSQSILVIGQVALAFVLLMGAGLFTRSFLALLNTPLGFNSHHVLTADVYLADTKYADGAQRKVFFDTLLDKARNLPGVIEAGLIDNLPFYNTDLENLSIMGQPATNPDHLPWMVHQIVSSNYFRVLGIPLLRGRPFDDRDQTGQEDVVIINQTIAQRFFSGEDPIGKRLDDLGNRYGRERHYCTIIGVAANVVHDNPESQETPFQAYYPYTQTAGGFGDTPKFETLVLHTASDAQSVIPSLRKSVAAIDPDLPLSNVGPYDDLIAKSFATKRLALVVLSLFSGAALLLAAIGLYAVLSYAVSQRTREIGVRMALGARSTSILGLITLQGLKMVSIGLVIGILAALILAGFIGSILYGIAPTDPVTLGTSLVGLTLSACLACLLPALRATRISPITALRE